MKKSNVVTRDELLAEYEKLRIKYQAQLPAWELHYTFILLSVKTLLDIAPIERVALETIRIATERGILWHVGERHAHANRKDKNL